VEVHSLAIPLAQALNCEGVAQVIGSRAAPAGLRLQTGKLEQMPESATCGLNWQSALVGADEEACVRA
jgi:hypothetical protein